MPDAACYLGMNRILVFRFSAMGDVAMTVPVLASVLSRYPDMEVVFVSRPVFRPLFAQMPENFTFVEADLKMAHKGIAGLYRLFRELKKMKYDGVADLHNVLRTRFLRILFRLSGVKVRYIDKGRKEKRQLVRENNKIFRPLKSMINRYAEVFERLGLPVEVDFTSIYGEQPADITHLLPVTGERTGCRWVGIAPFAKHKGKTYPLMAMEQVVAALSGEESIKIFLFGGGPGEAQLCKTWEERYPQVVALPGKVKMSEELQLISNLDVMVSMDSANMHLASLVNTPVVSIWGATHPYCGFMGWRQSYDDIVDMKMECRPCSVFGNKPCRRGDYACLNEITPERVVEQVKKKLPC